MVEIIRIYGHKYNIYLILRLLNGTGLLTDTILILIIYFTRINITLAVFNLIPISPLDGSQIFSNYLLKYNPELAWKLQAYGPQVLFGLILFGYITGFSIIWMIMEPFVNFFMMIFNSEVLNSYPKISKPLILSLYINQ